MARWILVVPFALASCAPDHVGQRVGRSLYNASVNTGHALAVAGDRTGEAIEDAGAHLRRAISPPQPLPPLDLPPPYVPEGYAPVAAEPLGPPGADDGARYAPANPALGY